MANKYLLIFNSSHHCRTFLVSNTILFIIDLTWSPFWYQTFGGSGLVPESHLKLFVSFCFYRIGNLNVKLSVHRMSFHFELVNDCLIVIESWNSNKMQVDLDCIHINQERKFSTQVHLKALSKLHFTTDNFSIIFPTIPFDCVIPLNQGDSATVVLTFVFNFSPISLNTFLNSSPLPGWNKFGVLKHSYPVFKYLLQDFAWIHFVLWSIQCKM